MSSLPEVMPFECVGPGRTTRDCYWKKVGFGLPKKGQWYASGAIPMAYQARADLSSSYLIVEPTHFAQQVTRWQRGEPIERRFA